MVVVPQRPEHGQVLVVGHQQGGEQGEGGHHLADGLRERALQTGDHGDHGQAVQGDQGEEEEEGGDIDQQQVDDQRVGGRPQRLLPGKDQQQGEVHHEGEQEEEGEHTKLHKHQHQVTFAIVFCLLQNAVVHVNLHISRMSKIVT